MRVSVFSWLAPFLFECISNRETWPPASVVPGIHSTGHVRLFLGRGSTHQHQNTYHTRKIESISPPKGDYGGIRLISSGRTSACHNRRQNKTAKKVTPPPVLPPPPAPHPAKEKRAGGKGGQGKARQRASNPCTTDCRYPDLGPRTYRKRLAPPAAAAAAPPGLRFFSPRS